MSNDLVTAIPDVELLLQLEPEELGARLLFLMRRVSDGMFHPDSIAQRTFKTWNGPSYPPIDAMKSKLPW